MPGDDDSSSFPFGEYNPGKGQNPDESSARRLLLDPVEGIPDIFDLGNLDIFERARFLAEKRDQGNCQPTRRRRRRKPLV